VSFTAAGSGPYQLRLVDATGHAVKEMGAVASQGQNQVRVETAGFARGLYLLHLRTGEGTFYKKVVIAR
jgi:hypothetical protein